MDIIIVGAGPCGLSTAISLAKVSTPEHPLRITVLELRAGAPTAGGTVNLTPLAPRYLDLLGAGHRIRSRGCKINAIDVVALRTGRSLGSLWAGHDLLRASRRDIIEGLLETVDDEYSGTINILYGKRTTSMYEVTNLASEEKVVLELEEGKRLEADLVLGCDGLHSAVRQYYVEPGRSKVYTDRVVVMGYTNATYNTKGVPDISMVSGKRAVSGTTMIHGLQGGLLVSYFEPTMSKLYLGAVMSYKEPEKGSRQIWTAISSDREAVRSDILRRWRGGRLEGLQDVVANCNEWTFYPIYTLPPGGRWSRGRVLLLGDAAHAMPPQGESTGLAIEDGVLLAHVFQRRRTRTVKQLLSDYESLRRRAINKHYRSAKWRWEGANADSSWLWNVVIEYFTVLFLAVLRWTGYHPFKGDVRDLRLPA